MADSTYNPNQDTDFINATPVQQHAYLVATDKDFARANPDDQMAYIRHLRGIPDAVAATGYSPEGSSLASAALGKTPAGVQLLPSGEAESSKRAAGRMALAVPGEIVRGVVGGITGIPSMIAHPIDTITEGLPQYINQKVQRIEQGDLFTGLETFGEMEALRAGVPAVARATNFSPTSTIIEHPVATKTLTTVGGGALGSLMKGGAGAGEIGGVYGGYRLGNELVRAAEEKAVSQAVEGDRPLDKLPTRLMPRYMSELNARANAYARQALESDQPIDTLKIPTGLENAVQRSYEEQVKMRPNLPRAVLTPEEVQTMEQRRALSNAATEDLRSAARLRGMAHAAGEHEETWAPKSQGINKTTTSSFRVLPRNP